MPALALPMPYVDPQNNTKKKIALFVTREGKSCFEHYDVNDGFGNLLFTTRRRFLTLTNRHILIDKQKERNVNIGQFRIKRNALLQDTYYLGTMDELKRFKLMHHKNCSSSKINIEILSNVSGKEISIGQVLGNCEMMSYAIVINHVAVASISPFCKSSSGSIDIMYRVLIEEGVDSAFVMLIVMTVEQLMINFKNPNLKENTGCRLSLH